MYKIFKKYFLINIEILMDGCVCKFEWIELVFVNNYLSFVSFEICCLN